VRGLFVDGMDTIEGLQSGSKLPPDAPRRHGREHPHICRYRQERGGRGSVLATIVPSTRDITHKRAMVEQDSRSSLRHILADEPVQDSPRPAPPATPASAPANRATTGDHEQSPAPGGDRDDKDDEHEAETPLYTSTTQTTRRNANGSVSSVYSGNKIRHLKKEDGVPLWRKDIQYDFLDMVFKDEHRVFTRYSDNEKGHTFAEVYVDAMAKSSKCSKILKEKLKEDFDSAITMAMVCLLVNVGRMNTTLNFFPEMRAQLRTYHSIPALQAHQDPNAYKQLQDAPRLKSILKGATEDTPQPGTIEDIRQATIPRTNPVNLIFVLSQYAPKISELHFNHPRDFFDLVMRPSLSSKSRATAFLWLMWWYLESDFSDQSALDNPFGAGCEPEGGGVPIKVPPLESLTEEQAALENVDSKEEKEYGEQKRKERIAIVASEPSPAMTALKRARKGILSQTRLLARS
jgi:Ino eighty subunit 1